MKNRMKSLLSLVLVASMVSLAACGGGGASSSNDENTSSDSAKAEAPADEDSGASNTEGRQFGIIYPIIHPFFEPIGAEAIEYGKEQGITVTANAPDSSNAQQQIEIMENLISMKVDGIAIGPTDSEALVPTIDKAIDAGIKVMCFESTAEGSKAAAFIGTDNYKAGRHLGQVIGRECNGEGKILILTGLPTQFSLNERIRGIKEYLEENYPDIEIADTQPSEGDPQKAVTCTENMIQAHPDFKAVVGIDATAGPAAASVWKAKGWQDDPDHMILTFDDMEDNLAGLKDGYIKAIVSQRQSTWAVQIVDMLNALCDGETVPEYTDTGSVEITKDNVDTYKEEPAWKE